MYLHNAILCFYFYFYYLSSYVRALELQRNKTRCVKSEACDQTMTLPWGVPGGF